MLAFTLHLVLNQSPSKTFELPSSWGHRGLRFFSGITGQEGTFWVMLVVYLISKLSHKKRKAIF